MKKFLFLFVTLLLTACQQEYKPYFSYNKNEQKLSFLINGAYQSYSISGANYTQRSSYGVREAFTLEGKDPNFFIEMFEVSHNVTWNGQARSLYENFLKESLRLKSLKVLFRIEVDRNYELTTYLVNGKYRLDLIYIFDMFKETMIFDGQGELYATIAKQLVPNFNDTFTNYSRFNIIMNKSFVEQNPLKNYFMIGN